MTPLDKLIHEMRSSSIYDFEQVYIPSSMLFTRTLISLEVLSPAFSTWDSDLDETLETFSKRFLPETPLQRQLIYQLNNLFPEFQQLISELSPFIPYLTEHQDASCIILFKFAIKLYLSDIQQSKTSQFKFDFLSELTCRALLPFLKFLFQKVQNKQISSILGQYDPELSFRLKKFDIDMTKYTKLKLVDIFGTQDQFKSLFPILAKQRYFISTFAASLIYLGCKQQLMCAGQQEIAQKIVDNCHIQAKLINFPDIIQVFSSISGIQLLVEQEKVSIIDQKLSKNLSQEAIDEGIQSMRKLHGAIQKQAENIIQSIGNQYCEKHIVDEAKRQLQEMRAALVATLPRSIECVKLEYKIDTEGYADVVNQVAQIQEKMNLKTTDVKKMTGEQ